MNTNVAKPNRIAIIGVSGADGRGMLARAEEIGVEVVVVTRSPHKFKEVKPTTTVVDAQLDVRAALSRVQGG
jgi:putative NADH-flavin reductase